MRRNFLIAIVLLWLPLVSWSQYKFEETLLITGEDFLYSQDIDSGNSQYIATGYKAGAKTVQKDILLVKWHDTPGYIWAKRYTGPGMYADCGYNVIKTQDSGYLVSGSTNSYSSGANIDGFALKLSQMGTVEWFNYFGNSYPDYAFSACENANYYFVAGRSGRSSTAINTNGIIYCFNKNTGAVVWGKRYKNYNDGYYITFNSILVGNDGNLFVAGTATTSTTTQVLCAKINPSNGALIWSYRYISGSAKLSSVNIAKGHNSGYIITGMYNLSTAYKAMLIEVSSSGVVNWSKCYYLTGTDDEGIQTVKTDTGYTMFGVTKSFGSDDLFLLNTDSSGSINWLHYYHGSSTTEGTPLFRSIGSPLLNLSDSGYAIVSGQKNASLLLDSYLLRTDSYGHTGCEQDSSFFTSTLSLTRYVLSDSLFNITATDTTITAYSVTSAWDTICQPDSLYAASKSLLGVDSRPLQGQPRIYPNPANETLNIDFGMPIKGATAISIFDLTGQLKMNMSYSPTGSSSISVDVKSLSVGMYFVRIQGVGINTTQKIVVE